MSDIATSAPAAAMVPPPSAPPSSAPPTPAEHPTSTTDLATLAGGDDDDATDYVEQRREDDGATGADLSEAEREYLRQRRLSHRRRRKEEVARLRAENEELRRAQGGSGEPAHEQPQSEQPTDVGGEQGEVSGEQAPEAGDAGAEAPQYHEPNAEAAEHIARAEQEAERQHELLGRDHQWRQREAATRLPRFNEVIAGGPRFELPPHIEQRLLSSDISADLQYFLSLDDPRIQRGNVALLQMSPYQAIREIDQLEAHLKARPLQARPELLPRAPQPRPHQVTKARRPMTPLRGGTSAGGNDWARLASPDNVSGYAAVRQRQMRSKR
jgi:hypothetical protein